MFFNHNSPLKRIFRNKLHHLSNEVKNSICSDFLNGCSVREIEKKYLISNKTLNQVLLQNNLSWKSIAEISCSQCHKIFKSKRIKNQNRLCFECKLLNKNRANQKNRESYLKNKNIVFDYYGRQCSCCDEKNFYFLTMDHINNDGSYFRKEMRSSSDFYEWIIKNNFPPDLQTLCMNCNWGKHRNGGICPHVQDKTLFNYTSKHRLAPWYYLDNSVDNLENKFKVNFFAGKK